MSTSSLYSLGAYWPLPIGSQGVNGAPVGGVIPPGYAWPNALKVLNDYPPIPPPGYAMNFSAISVCRLTPDGLNFQPQPVKLTELSVYVGFGTGYVIGGSLFSNGAYFAPNTNYTLSPTPIVFGAIGAPETAEFFPIVQEGNSISGAFPSIKSSYLSAPVIAKGFDAAVATVQVPALTATIPSADYTYGSCAIQILASIELDSQFLANDQTSMSDLVIVIPFGTGSATISPNLVMTSTYATPESSLGCFFIPLQSLKNASSSTVTLTHLAPQTSVASRSGYIVNINDEHYLLGQRHTAVASFLPLNPLIPPPSLALCDEESGGGPLP